MLSRERRGCAVSNRKIGENGGNCNSLLMKYDWRYGNNLVTKCKVGLSCESFDVHGQMSILIETLCLICTGVTYWNGKIGVRLL